MNSENNESAFDEKFATIEEALKYVADSQAKSEWLIKQDQIERKKYEKERREFEQESQKRWEQTQKQLDYITKLTGIAFEDILFQEDKLQKAGEILQENRNSKS